MRGSDEQPGYLFSYVSAEARVPARSPAATAEGRIADDAMRRLSLRLEQLYVRWAVRRSCRRSRCALLLQILYTVRSRRQLVEQLQYNLLFQWFVGLSFKDVVWDATTLRRIGIGCSPGTPPSPSFRRWSPPPAQRLLSTEHFTVDSTLLDARANQKSFRPRDEDAGPNDPDRGNPPVNFRGTQRRDDTHQSTTTRMRAWRGRARARGQAAICRACLVEKSPRVHRQYGPHVRGWLSR